MAIWFAAPAKNFTESSPMGNGRLGAMMFGGVDDERLVVGPANSPENHFQMKNGQQAAICMGPTMMQQLVRYFFDACIQSSQVLGVDEDFRNELTSKRTRLAPTQISSYTHFTHN